MKLLKSGLQPEDIANLMLKMIESREYEGRTCVLKVTKGEEHTQEEEELSKKAAKCNSDPKPEPDLKRIQSLMRVERERGKKWTYLKNMGNSVIVVLSKSQVGSIEAPRSSDSPYWAQKQMEGFSRTCSIGPSVSTGWRVGSRL